MRLGHPHFARITPERADAASNEATPPQLEPAQEIVPREKGR
jgi:hypothetical protein